MELQKSKVIMTELEKQLKKKFGKTKLGKPEPKKQTVEIKTVSAFNMARRV